MSSVVLCNNSLVDICTVSVDKALPREARIFDYIRQIKNPYHYKCGKFTITERHVDSDLTIEDCLMQMII